MSKDILLKNAIHQIVSAFGLGVLWSSTRESWIVYGVPMTPEEIIKYASDIIATKKAK